MKLPLKNKVINGSFDFWQRNNTFAAPANGNYTADRWAYGKQGTAVHTIARSTDLPPNSSSVYSLLATVTTAQASFTGTDSFGIQQRIEGNVLRSFKNKKMVLSFWVKASKVGQASATFLNGSLDRSLNLAYTINQANTWERKILRFTHDGSGTWFYDASIGTYLWFALAVGPTRTGVSGVWQNGNFHAAAGQTNFCDTIGNTFQLADICLLEDNEGQTRDSEFLFAGNDIFEELQLCLRYFEKSWNVNTPVGTNVGDGSYATHSNTSNNNSFGAGSNFLVRKRVTPTFRYYGANGVADVITTNGGNTTAGAVIVGESGYNVICADAVLVKRTLQFHWTADAEL